MNYQDCWPVAKPISTRRVIISSFGKAPGPDCRSIVEIFHAGNVEDCTPFEVVCSSPSPLLAKLGELSSATHPFCPSPSTSRGAWFLIPGMCILVLGYSSSTVLSTFANKPGVQVRYRRPTLPRINTKSNTAPYNAVNPARFRSVAGKLDIDATV